MKLHFGKPEDPGIMRFITRDYWFSENGGPRQSRRYSKPQAISWPIKSMWGFSMPSLGFFIGIVRLGKDTRADAGEDAKLLPPDPNAPEKCSTPRCDGWIPPGGKCNRCFLMSDNVLVNFPRK